MLHNSRLALVVAHDGAAVRLDDGREGSSVEVAARYPAWELVVPDQVVTCYPILSECSKTRMKCLSPLMIWPFPSAKVAI